MKTEKSPRLEFPELLAGGEFYRTQFYELYQFAFPEEEKKPEDMLERMAKEGKLELLAVVQEGKFAGLVIHMLAGKKVLLDYFAIAERLRGQGIGGRVIQAMQERFVDKKYILEIEMQDSYAPNAEERFRRKCFYLENGLKETGVLAHAYDTDFELLTPDGNLTYEEYEDVLRLIMGKDLYMVNPSPIKRKEMQQNHEETK